MSDDRPIAVFDSGVGGLTVAAEIHRQLPAEAILYFGDTARVPYGPKSPATVRRYADEILDWLLGQSVKAVVVACNTVTAHAISGLQSRAGSTPVIGVIEPGARAAVAATRRGAVGVIGTAGTIASGAYRRALLHEQGDLQVVDQPCPLFVPLVEEGWFEHPATRMIAEEYLAPVQQAGVDTLVLGCTHYPMLAPLLAQVMGDGVGLIDSARETARALVDVLESGGLRTARAGTGSSRWVVTDEADRFRQVAAQFLGSAPRQVEVVDLAGSAPVVS